MKKTIGWFMLTTMIISVFIVGLIVLGWGVMVKALLSTIVFWILLFIALLLIIDE